MSSSIKQTSAKKPKGGPKCDVLQEQDVLQAVVIAESFSNEFAPLTSEKPSALFPLVNKCLLDYSLESLEKCGIQETFIFCSSHSQLIRNHVLEKWSSRVNSSMVTTVISSENIMSTGDALRELDSKALIRSDFVLINGHVVNTLPLDKIMEEHKSVRKMDKGCAMTLMYRKVNTKHRSMTSDEKTILAEDANTRKIKFYNRPMNKKSFIPLEVFQENENVIVHYDLLNCCVSICSPAVPPLYSDNFDYQTFDDLVRGLIINEEVLCQSMYLHIANFGYCSSITNFLKYDFVSQDIMYRWTYPQVPDRFFHNNSRYSHDIKCNIYKDTDLDLHRNSHLAKNVVIGRNSTVGENTYIANTVIGRNCKIGANVKISGCYIWDNVSIGDNCELDTCLLAESVVLKDFVNVLGGCILSTKVVIGDYVTVPSLTRLRSEPPDDDDEFGDDDDRGSIPDIIDDVAVCDPRYVGVNGHGYLYAESEDSEDEDIRTVWGKLPDKVLSDEDDESALNSHEEDVSDRDNSDDDDDVIPVGEEEDTMLFYNEVLDSLQRGIEEKISSENLILEINSSKYAYNVTMKEVNCLVMKAILNIPNKSADITAQEYFLKLRSILSNLFPLICNYIKNASSQVDCLQSMEEFITINEHLLPAFKKILHDFYDKEVLNENVIFRWFENLSSEADFIKIQIEPFVNWLKEADEESSDE